VQSTRPRPRALAAVLLPGLLLAAACRPDDRTDSLAAPASSASGIRLVVLVIIDQLPSWSFDADRPSLKGGIARLAEQGVTYPRVELPYAGTFAASGHAALATGAPPSVTGILADEWHRATGDRALACTVDPDDLTRRSGRQLRTDGVADVLERETRGASHTVAISLRDRSAIFAIGRRPDLAVWYDPDRAAMTTDRFYAAEPPPWLRELASDRPASRFFRAVWRPVDKKLVAELSGSIDRQAGELGNDGFDAAFPHSLAGVARPAHAIVNTPFGTELIFEAASAALRGEQMGVDDVPDLLALSISPHDDAAQGWAQESWERVDLLLRLDQQLGAFLAELDRTVGASRYAVLLTSDRGATRLVERQQSAGRKFFRIERPQIRDAAERAARKVLGVGPWVRGISGNLVHVVPAFAEQPGSQRDFAIREMIAALRAIPGTGLVAPTAELRSDCARQPDALRRMMCLSLPDGPLGPIAILPADGSQVANEHPWGAGQGGPSVDERTVPLLLLAPGRPPGRRPAPASLLQVAPTLAALLGIPPPPASREPAL
jgi:arylsulfatase A-like enzyme